jgi:hypothetical protein
MPAPQHGFPVAKESLRHTFWLFAAAWPLIRPDLPGVAGHRSRGVFVTAIVSVPAWARPRRTCPAGLPMGVIGIVAAGLVNLFAVERPPSR